MVNKPITEMQQRRLSKIVISVAIAIISALIIFALVYSLSTGDIYTREELWTFVKENPTPEGCASVCDYLEYWNFPKFDKDELLRVESIFDLHYYKQLPENSTIAYKTAYKFTKTDYDYINLFDKSEITHVIIDCYIEAVGDKYAHYRSPEEQDEFNSSMESGKTFTGIGISTSGTDDYISVLRVTRGSPAERSGIRAGDKIIAIDGVPVTNIGHNAALNMITGEAGTTVAVTVDRKGGTLLFNVTREVIVEQTAYAQILDNNIGYLTVTSFKRDTVAEFIEAVNELEEAGVDGIIFDLSYNTGGYLSSCRDMLSYLVPNGTPLYSKPKENSGIAVVAASGSPYEPKDHFITVPTVFICNEYTASAGELFCAALRDYNRLGILESAGVGITTYGKGIVQNAIKLSSGSYLTLTTDYYNPPCGENYDGVGITPDINLAFSPSTDTLSIAEAKLLLLIRT